MNEEQLLKDIENDPQRFAEVYNAFHGKIFGYVYRRTTDYDAAMDITAETFMKAFVNINKFKWRDISLLYWLYQIATNELNKYFTSTRYKPASLNRIQEEYGIDLTDHSNAETESIKLQDDLEKREEFVKISLLIKKMDTKYQDVISLRFFEHKSVREIASILSKKEGTIKSLLSRGIEKLKDNLNEAI